MRLSKFSSCEFDEGFKGETSDSFGIEIGEDVVDEFIGGCESKTDECVFEFDWVYDSTSVAVKYVESIFNLFYFLD